MCLLNYVSSLNLLLPYYLIMSEMFPNLNLLYELNISRENQFNYEINLIN